MEKKEKIQKRQPIIIGTTPIKKSATKGAKLKIEDVETRQIEVKPLTVLQNVDYSQIDGDFVLVKDFNIEDFMEALQTKKMSSNSTKKTVSDEILEKFDLELEEKGFGDDYFKNIEKEIKEMELESEMHEYAINEILNEKDYFNLQR